MLFLVELYMYMSDSVVGVYINAVTGYNYPPTENAEVVGMLEFSNFKLNLFFKFKSFLKPVWVWSQTDFVQFRYVFVFVFIDFVIKYRAL